MPRLRRAAFHRVGPRQRKHSAADVPSPSSGITAMPILLPVHPLLADGILLQGDPPTIQRHLVASPLTIRDALLQWRLRISLCMSDTKSAERCIRRACRNLGFVLNRSRSQGGYSVIHVDGTAVIGHGTLTLDEVDKWLTETGTRMRREVTHEQAPDRGNYDLHVGDAATVLRTLPADTFQACVTSPPYFQHRDYGVVGQIGQEATPSEYINRLAEVFDEVLRTLRADGTLWIIIGDTYVSNPSTSTTSRIDQGNGTGRFRIPDQHHADARRGKPNRATPLIRSGLPKKSLIGIPGRLTTELQARGWIYRDDIIWQKPAGLPENVRDRQTNSYEHVLQFAKSDRYYYDCAVTVGPTGGNGRNVWTIPTNGHRGDHHAMMPVALAERCILLGSPVGAMILDPFAGLGTVGLAAIRHGRNATLVELNPKYAARIRHRLA